MNSALRAHREEEGFTLIELLVVVIIIGILAAIAIPAFLNQRERAWQAELTSAVRNGALDVEAEATAAGGNYPAAWANEANFEYDDTGDGVADATVLTYFQVAATDFCLVGQDARINAGNNYLIYQATQGGLLQFTEAAYNAANNVVGTDCTDAGA